MIALVYEELRRIAHRQLMAEPTGHTLSTTAVVHEAYLRLAQQQESAWANRAHFFAIAARMMRRVLVDYARQHGAVRRGGADQERVSLAELESDSRELSIDSRAEELLALDAALEQLALVDERLARVVECRYFAGLTEDETATVLGTSKRTVSRDWELAKGWLYQRLRNDR
jgi:RNA polymerase sigma factor (TIGR02999 family)